MADGYIAPWGNDNNSGLDWANAKKSLQGGVDAALTPLYAKGFYNEAVDPVVFSGEGNLLICDGSFLPNGAFNTCQPSFVIFQNFANYTWPIKYSNCVLRWNTNTNIVVNGEVSNVLAHDSVYYRFIGSNIKEINTFHNITELLIKHRSSEQHRSIFSNSDVNFQDSTLNYSLLINCNIKFTGGGLGFDEVSYTAASGIDDAARLQDLKDRMIIVYGAGTYLVGCQVWDVRGDYTDIFTNADNGDFSLVPDCVAGNMAYDGSYIGAIGIGNEMTFDTDFNSIINISETPSTLGYIEDQTTDATCSTNIKDLGVIKNIKRFKNIGCLAYRNGQRFSNLDDLGPEISAGTDLEAEESYLVVNNTVTYNAVTYNPWDTFKCITGTLGFTGTGQCQKCIQDNFDERVQIKVSQTDPTLSGVATLTVFLHQDIQINEDVNGIPTFGNADAGYISGSAVDLDIRYYQVLAVIKAENLPAR